MSENKQKSQFFRKVLTASGPEKSLFFVRNQEFHIKYLQSGAKAGKIHLF